MELRRATREEFDEFGRAALSAFHQELNDADRERYARIDEPERSLAWFDDGRIVATSGAYTRELSVPGAVVRCAAVTAVAVVATHRRRGLLTAMMRRQLEDLRERGDSVAALWASEGGIYGRSGYGIAAPSGSVGRSPTRRSAGSGAGGRLSRCAPAAPVSTSRRCAPYTSGFGRAAGDARSSGAVVAQRLNDPESLRHGAQPLQAVIVEDGYALYAVRADSDEDGPAARCGCANWLRPPPTRTRGCGRFCSTRT